MKQPLLAGALVVLAAGWSRPCQAQALLQPPAPWLPSLTLQQPVAWTPAPGQAATTAWMASEWLPSPSGWSVVTQLVPLDLGSIPSRPRPWTAHPPFRP